MAKARSRTNSRHDVERRRLAHEIARMMWEYSIEDFRLAKDKAVKRMGLRYSELPDNRQIAEELSVYSALFAASEVADRRSQLLQAAEKLMHHFETYSPRLIGLEKGAVITPNSGLKLHIFCEHPEIIDLYLQEKGIEYQLKDKRFRFGAEDYEYRPTYCFDFEGVKAEVSAFSTTGRSRVPLSPVDGKPVQSMSLKDIAVMRCT